MNINNKHITCIKNTNNATKEFQICHKKVKKKERFSQQTILFQKYLR